MTSFGELSFGKKSFEVEEANLYAIFTRYNEMQWWIEIFPNGEDNYIMLNALVFDNLYSPRQLSNLNYDSSSDEYSEPMENPVIVNGKERFMKTLKLSFGQWDENNSIKLNGEGIIERSGLKGTLKFRFSINLLFSVINIFETNELAVQTFLDTYLKDIKQDLRINFEKVQSGLQAKISGQF
jgi:hypothetical protein